MKAFRVLMMLTTLLATATTIHAQAISPAALKALQAAGQDRPNRIVIAVPGTDQPALIEIELATQSIQPDCPAANGCSWYMQALQQGVASISRLRAMCSSSQASSGCCEAAVTKVGCAKATGCVVGVAGCVKGCETVQAPKSCCCAKACACCESCKEKKVTTAGVQMPSCLTLDMVKLLSHRMGGGCTQAVPVAACPYPTPVAIASCPAVATHVVTVAHHVRPVHLVTPDLDAHCERMTHRGDMIVLEGNVLLLCKKHAQPIRIEAQRVLVNMKDGSFTVESASVIGQTTFGTIGVQRTSGVIPMPTAIDFGFGQTPPTCPVQPAATQGIIRVVPVPTYGTPSRATPSLPSVPGSR